MSSKFTRPSQLQSPRQSVGTTQNHRPGAGHTRVARTMLTIQNDRMGVLQGSSAGSGHWLFAAGVAGRALAGAGVAAWSSALDRITR